MPVNIFKLFATLFMLSILLHQGLGRAYKSKHGDKPNEEKKDICLTKGCIRTANSLLLDMDLTADPCHDFYQYTCGNWMKHRVIKEEESHVSQFSEVDDALTIILKDILEDKNTDSLTKPDRLALQAYEACMNESYINERKGKPLLETLDTLIGGWPILMESWDSSSLDWISATATLNLYSIGALISFSVDADASNNSVNLAQLDQTSLGMNRHYFQEDKYKIQRKAYQTLFEDIVRLLNNGELTKQQKKDIKEVIQFEKKLVNLTKPPEERRNQTRMYNVMTVAELQSKFSKIDFKKFFSKILQPNNALTDYDRVNVVEVEYFEQLGDFIENTNKRIIANYINWRFVKHFTLELSEEFKDIIMKYKKVMDGSSQIEATWKSCVDYANNYLGLALGMRYAKQEFSSEAQQTIDELINSLIDTFGNTLSEADWMDSKTKKSAKEKLHKIMKNIGYQKEYENPDEIMKEFEGLEPLTGDHFSNALKLEKFSANYFYKELHKPFNKTRWTTFPSVVNAYYSATRNSISFPAGILQFPFFDATRPRSVNYGFIGTVIGHEITHGFDDEGKQFDGDGNLKNWWSKSSEKKYLAKSECIVDQFNSYYVPEVNLTVNGKTTQGENLADTGGLKEAYLAFKQAEKENGPEPLLPGLDFNHDQLFFISFGTAWCGKVRNESLRGQMLGDAHSPNQYRVQGSIANSPEFKEAFNCKKISKMQQKKSCSVW